MKATELMIGDWVSSFGNNCRITAIDKYDAKVCTDPEDELFFLDDIYPIPLTYEILKKNGWKDAEFWCEYQDGNNSIQSCLPDMRGRINGIEIEHFQCEYVHQYQHLLRLCGLDELANNFKV